MRLVLAAFLGLALASCGGATKSAGPLANSGNMTGSATGSPPMDSSRDNMMTANTAEPVDDNLMMSNAAEAANGVDRASGRAYCAVVQDYAAPDDCAYMEEMWRRLAPGRAAMDVPSPMQWNREHRVSLALTRDAAGGAAGEASDPAEHLDSAAERTVTLRVGRTMAVRLSGTGFAIAPAELVERDLAAGGAARWDWSVRPTDPARRKLTLTFNVYVVVTPPGGQRTENLIRTLSQEVDVDISAGDRTKQLMKEGEGWLGATNSLLLALAALLGGGALAVWLALRKFRAAKAKKDDPPAGG